MLLVWHHLPGKSEILVVSETLVVVFEDNFFTLNSIKSIIIW